MKLSYWYVEAVKEPYLMRYEIRVEMGDSTYSHSAVIAATSESEVRVAAATQIADIIKKEILFKLMEKQIDSN